MWKDYSVNYLKKNKSTAVSIMVAVLVASMFISFLCTLFYNMWIDNVDRIKADEGDWQVKITSVLSDDEIKTINNFANVDKVVKSDDLKSVDIYFTKSSDIYKDMPLIVEKLNIDDEHIEYHSTLLQKQFIYSKEKGEKPMPIELLYGAIILMMSVSLIMIIKNAFSFSMNTRIRQFGILQSIGATPKQLRAVMVQEALILSVPSVIVGIATGVGLDALFIKYANSFTSQIGLQGAKPHYHILLFIITFTVTMLTVFISMWLPARKLSKSESIELVKGQSVKKVKKIRKYKLFSKLFGVEGELARKSIYVRRKEFRTASVCLMLSFFVLSIFLNFMTISEISTSNSYWKRYENAWDIMVEMKGEEPDIQTLNSIREMNGVSSAIFYKTAAFQTVLTDDNFSNELIDKGSYKAMNTDAKQNENGDYVINAPVLVLDDDNFEKYCADNNIENSKDNYPNSVVINKIGGVLYYDSDDSHSIPFMNEDNSTLNLLSSKDGEQVENKVNIIGYSQNVPQVRKDFDRYSLLQVMSESSYKAMINAPLADTAYININTKTEDNLADIESEIKQIIDNDYNYTIENRIDAYKTNMQMYEGYKSIITIICAIFACIGISNVFANTLGYMQQRKREFAEYQSIGVTPKSIAKILSIEALVIGVRPILWSILFNILFILLTTSDNGITLSEFLSNAPILPTILFAVIMLSAIALSYLISGKKILNANIADVLKDDTIK
ncbi:MAG: ABC transporter permease [Eubacterium sp.]